MAGFSSFSQRWRLRAEIAKDQITSLYAGTNHDSRYEVVSCHVDCQSRPISNLYFHRFIRQSRPYSLHRRVALHSTSPPPQPHGGARRTPLALSRFARRSMEIPMAVQPSSATARERHQGIHTVAVVMATTHSVANNDVRQTLGRRVLL